jgi:NAD-dependent deacetylase
MASIEPVEERDVDRAVEKLIALARGRHRIVAFTGAGISTDSGIPDYRGPGGVWEQRRPPTVGDFLENAETRRAYWRRRRHDYPLLAARQPNAGHLALAALERAGSLLAVITQNIDGLHQKAGNAPERVLELHGTSHLIRCTNCGRTWSGMEIARRLEAGEVEPACVVCGGILRSATVLFGEPLPKEALDRSVAAARNCDLMLVVGSSLVVNPAARLPLVAKQSGAALAIVNRTPTALDDTADVHVLGEAASTLRALSDALLA